MSAAHVANKVSQLQLRMGTRRAAALALAMECREGRVPLRDRAFWNAVRVQLESVMP